MLFAVTGLLLPSRLQSPSLCPVETIAAPKRGNGAERNRTAVRNTGVDHLVRQVGRCHSDSSGGLEHTPLARTNRQHAIAVLPEGLEAAGCDELTSLGAHTAKPRRRAVSFEADMACLYRLHLQARLPFRLLREMARFPCHGREDLLSLIHI